MSDIIRQAAAIPSNSRKRKPESMETRNRADSVLDGAVDDLFFSSALPDATASTMAGTGIVYAPAANKSELIFDEGGNMVLQQVAASSVADRLTTSVEATTTVESATCGYDFAYRKPKPTKWSKDDTSKFYEALELYGSDQMLINTALPHFTSVQIRQKFKAEERNNSIRFNKALYGSRKKLDSTKFEQQHGLIVNPVYDHKSEEVSNESIADRIGALVDSVLLPDDLLETDPQAVTTSSKADYSDPLASLFQ